MGPVIICFTLALLQGGYVFGDENVPQFRDISALDSRYLREDFPVGGTVGVIDAYDPDGKSVDYYIDGAGGDYFAIGRTSGIVTLKKELEFDNTKEERELRVKIRVVDEDQQENTVDGKVFVQDANDLPPEFERYDIFEILPENTVPGKLVSTIKVTDRDRTSEILQVTCLGNSKDFADACDTFSIHYTPADISNKEWIGEIRLAKPLDYETRISYAILLNANDGIHDVTNEVHIEVTDINDSPPTWTRIVPVTIPEEPKPGTLITTVTASDGDITDPRDIFYEIIPTTYSDGAIFAINNVTGVISNVNRLDYDSVNHNKGQAYEITLRAREVISRIPLELGNDAITTSTSVVGITIQDIDDNAPTFNEDDYTATIPESIATAGNIPGLQMTITDIDSGTFNSFTLHTLDWQDVFSIIPEVGKSNAGAAIFIKDGEKIDYEKGPTEYVIRVEARENLVDPSVALTGSALVTIKVKDVNDESPRFSQETYSRSILETKAPGTVIIDLDAVDDEEGILGTDGIRYKLYGNQQNHFQIDEITGVISIAPCSTPGTFPCIDYERKNQYVLTVSATDYEGRADKGRTRSVQVIVAVEDENDNLPKPADKYVAYIYEEQTVPVQPLLIKAEDPDTVGGPVVYQLKGPSAVIGNWKIEMINGEGGQQANITAIRPVLFSDAQNPITGALEFEVVSSDQKTSVTSEVTVYIIDINNNNPKFSTDQYEESIKEDRPGDTFVIQVTASDGDAPTTGNGIVDFFIKDGAQGKFTAKSPKKVDGKYLVDIYTTPDATFNYDTEKKYTMTLLARDQGTPESKRGSATLVVNIIDINNKDPQITPTSVSITVPEDRVPNVKVHTVIAIDSDKTADLRYYMTARRAQNPSGVIVDKNDYNYEELFRIEEETGIVRVNKPLNREQTSFLVNDLKVIDIAATPPQTGIGALFITITEVNDQDPEFDLPLYDITIDEELNINYFVRNLHCSDEDDQIASYTLTQTSPRSPNFFTLMDNSGSLMVADRIDFEQLEEIRLVATCFDDGVPQRFGKTDVIIRIANINDNSPEFGKRLYRAQIAENELGQEIGGTFVTKVSATDIDKGDFGVVRFKLADDSLPFEIDSIDGTVTVKQGTLFDREMVSSYGFQVVAYDSPNTPQFRKETTVPVYLTIDDINDNCPVFDKPIYSGSIPESAKTGTDTIDVIASDRDDGENKLIAFSVQAGSFVPPEGNLYFSIGAKSGRVFTQGTLTGKSGTYRFNVTATDTGGNKPTIMCSTHVPVIVEVVESENYAPKWIDPPNRDYVIYILESQYEGMLVYDSKAEDQDSGLSGVVDYFFVEGNDHVHATKEFRINMQTGIIRAEIEFDREQVDRYFLTLVAKDQGATRASSETTLIVVILDVNDNDPEFDTNNGVVAPLVLPNFELKEDVIPMGRGLSLGRCQANDADLNDKIFYEILTANDDVGELIHVDRDTCEVILKEKVDYEKTPQLEFSIFASNENNDDRVRRHKRDVNRSILPVVIKISDVNDNPPKFDETEYFACAPLQSPFKSSIIDLDAHDKEQDDVELKYSLDGTTDFDIDGQGIIHNEISFSGTDKRVYAFNARANDGANSASSRVNIFVTSDSSQVMLTVDRPSSDVRRIKEEYEEIILEAISEIKFACSEVLNHINGDGSVSSSKSDVYVAAVVEEDNKYVLWSGSKLYEKVAESRRKDPGTYQGMFVEDISTVDDDGFGLDEDVVVAILIVAVLLIVLAVLLFILACCCIWSKKKKKVRKVKAQRHTIVQNTETKGEQFENPVYHNAGYVSYEDEYSTVRKEARPVIPVAIPVPQNLQPLTSFQPTHLEPVEQSPPEIPDPPEPVIETEVLPAGEPESPPPVPTAFEPEYEDRIETVVEDDHDLPLPDPPVDADEIETEIQDDSPPTTPRSISPEPTNY